MRKLIVVIILAISCIACENSNSTNEILTMESDNETSAEVSTDGSKTKKLTYVENTDVIEFSDLKEVSLNEMKELNYYLYINQLTWQITDSSGDDYYILGHGISTMDEGSELYAKLSKALLGAEHEVHNSYYYYQNIDAFQEELGYVSDDLSYYETWCYIAWGQNGEYYSYNPMPYKAYKNDEFYSSLTDEPLNATRYRAYINADRDFHERWANAEADLEISDIKENIGSDFLYVGFGGNDETGYKICLEDNQEENKDLYSIQFPDLELKKLINNIPIENVFDMMALSVSPDGRYIAYEVDKVVIGDSGYRTLCGQEWNIIDLERQEYASVKIINDLIAEACVVNWLDKDIVNERLGIE